MNIQWFPGHMAKTRSLIAENLKLVDCVIELADARLPLSSRNPEIDKLLENKPRLFVMNKADIADGEKNNKWKQYFKNQGISAVLLNSLSGKGMEQIVPAIKELLKDKIAREQEKGMVARPIKVMVVGIPNVGKSSFINQFTGKASTKTGDRPGVTRGKQWIRLKNGFELLDTPGILWPKFEDEEVAKRLAFTGAIRDEILDVEELAHYLMEYLREAYPERIAERYKIEDFANLKGYEIVEKIGRKRGFIISGGEVNTERASITVLDEFRGGYLGNITLEIPKEE